MQLLDLANQLNLSPKRVASTNGGEYHSACPRCGGKDRFIIWNVTGRYYCRQCEIAGDAIQFCRDFMGMDYCAACAMVGAQEKLTFPHTIPRSQKFVPEAAKMPSEIWQSSARDFVMKCHQHVIKDKNALKTVQERGFNCSTISEFSIGWNSQDSFLPLSGWGLPPSLNEKNQERKLWLPKGIVVPTISNGNIIKLKIRRSAWTEEDYLPKYVEVSGSMKSPSIYGNHKIGVFTLIEAELDAILIQQFAADTCCSVALGGVGKKPDAATHQLLSKAPLLLYSLDFDDAGKKAFRFWKSTYPNLRPWPISKAKSPGDAFKLGVDLRKWILAGCQKVESII